MDWVERNVTTSSAQIAKSSCLDLAVQKQRFIVRSSRSRDALQDSLCGNETLVQESTNMQKIKLDLSEYNDYSSGPYA